MSYEGGFLLRFLPRMASAVTACLVSFVNSFLTEQDPVARVVRLLLSREESSLIFAASSHPVVHVGLIIHCVCAVHWDLVKPA